MSLLVRKSKNSARLIRRSQKGLGNGKYEVSDVGIGSLPLTTTELPSGFPKGHPPLTATEMATLEWKLFAPARALLERIRVEAQEAELDPTRRVPGALKLLHEIAHLSQARPLDPETKAALSDALSSLGFSKSSDPLEAVLGAYREATVSVENGHYGIRHPETHINETRIAHARKAIEAADNALTAALRIGHWVKRETAKKEGKSRIGMSP